MEGGRMSNFVSRGGLKLQAAIENWKLEIENSTCLDVGSSTGGFVDCLLQNKAAKVYAVDTCYGELAWKLRNDPKVVVLERTNILHLEKLPPERHSGGSGTTDRIPDRDAIASLQHDDSMKVDLITIDAGWTKLELVLPKVKKFLKPDGIIIALLKPHYECDKADLIKGVLPPEKAEEIKNQVIKTINDMQFTINEVMGSPILGGAGNREYLLKILI